MSNQHIAAGLAAGLAVAGLLAVGLQAGLLGFLGCNRSAQAHLYGLDVITPASADAAAANL